MTNHEEALNQAKHVGDALSAFVVLGTLVGYLPYVAALLTIIWTGIRILETDTVQRMLKRLRGR